MGKKIEEPHKYVLELVKNKWANECPKSFWRKLTSFIFINPTAIEITQTNTVDEDFKHCNGKKLRRWWYNDEGLRIIPLDSDTDKEILNHCRYCLDEEKKQFAIVWENIFSGSFKGSKIRYGVHGAIYKIVDDNGVEKYQPINVWIV